MLEILADPESIFIKGLAKFERRTLYANIVNDRSAVYYTTGLSKIDPFTNLDNIKINYLKGYEDVIVDPDRPIAPNDPEESDLPFSSRFARSSQTTIGSLPFLLAMVFFIPIGVVAFLINSGVQSFRSTRRIRLRKKGLAGAEPGNYLVPLLITGMRETVEDACENLNSAQSHEYLVDGTEEEPAQEEPNFPRAERPQSPKHSQEPMYLNGQSEKKRESRQPDVPTLALAPYQFRMIQALDNVGWRKYPVHIHKVIHSHAAIIVRARLRRRQSSPSPLAGRRAHTLRLVLIGDELDLTYLRDE